MPRGILRIFRRNGWVIGLCALFGLLLVVTRIIQPGYGAAGFGSLAQAALPFAFAAAAQAIVVIVGGVDLSLASMMALTSVTAATLMEDASEEFAIVVVVLVLLLGLVLGAINGTLVVITRVPDIVVTLAMLFVWEGAALLVLEAPGGAAAQWLMALVVGSIGGTGSRRRWCSSWSALGVVWLPLRRSHLGLSLYAVGSDPLAAFRSGVAVERTKIAAYALAGLFGGDGRPRAHHEHRHRRADSGAVPFGERRRGRARRRDARRRQGRPVRPDRRGLHPAAAAHRPHLLAIDPNITTIIEGTIMVIVVMLGGLIALRSRTS